MTSQSLPVKLMELNCKIYFWMEKGKRRATTESKGRNNKKKGLNGIWHKQHNVPVHCAYTRSHCHRKNWWTGDNGTTITTTTGKRFTTKIHINIIFNFKLCVCVWCSFFSCTSSPVTRQTSLFHSLRFIQIGLFSLQYFACHRICIQLTLCMPYGQQFIIIWFSSHFVSNLWFSCHSLCLHCFSFSFIYSGFLSI